MLDNAPVRGIECRNRPVHLRIEVLAEECIKGLERDDRGGTFDNNDSDSNVVGELCSSLVPV